MRETERENGVRERERKGKRVEIVRESIGGKT